MVDLQRGEPVQLLPVIIGRQDIEHGEFRQPAGMIERQPIRHPPAAVVAGEREMHMAELLHRLHHHLRHRALGVGRVVVVAARHVRPAIARQIGDDQRELVRQLRRHRMPHHMRRRKSVQQQQRRPLAADAGEDAARRGVDPFGGVSGKQIGKIGHGALPWAALLQTLFGVAAGTSRVYAIPQARPTRTRSEETPCRSISKSRPKPRRSAKRSANGCMTSASPRKRNSTPSRSPKCSARCGPRPARAACGARGCRRNMAAWASARWPTRWCRWSSARACSARCR